MAQHQVVLHGRAAQVQIAVAQAQAFVRPGVIGDVERRRQGAVQHRERSRHHFNVARGHQRVFAARRTPPDVALDLHHPFLPQFIGGLGGLGRKFGIADHLHHAGAVAQIQEYDPAVVAAASHPPGQSDLGIGVGRTQIAAVGAL